MSKELNELKAQILASQEALKQVKANGLETEKDQVVENVVRNISNYLDHIWRYVGYLEQDLYEFKSKHTVGHLPPIKTASDMQNALNILGIGDDYEVYKPTISVAKRKYGVEITATYKK